MEQWLDNRKQGVPQCPFPVRVTVAVILALAALLLALYLHHGLVAIEVHNDSGRTIRVAAASPDLAPAANLQVELEIKPAGRRTLYYPREKIPNGVVELTAPGGRQAHIEVTCRGFGGCSLEELTKRIKLSKFKQRDG